MQTLAAEIIQGRRLTRLDDLTPLLQAGLEDLSDSQSPPGRRL